MQRRHFVLASAAAPAAAQPALEARLALPKGKVAAVLDTDTYNEIDDQFAVAYAALSPEHIDLQAVYAAPYLNDRSTSASDGMQKSYEEILRILARLNRKHEGFAFKGSERFFPAAGKPVESAAARDLVTKAMAPRAGPLYVLTVGAPTNVSSALLLEPRIKDRIVVVWLGGQPYDYPTAREFNLFQDLHASRVLYDSGVPLLNVPTRNVSEHLRTTIVEVEYFLKGRSPIASYLCSEFLAYARSQKVKLTYPWSKVIWDISCVAWMINPAWVPSKVVPSPKLTDDFKYQNAPGRHPVRVATWVNRDAVFNDLFSKLAAA
jgi:inosine-uridine nucleoside N-ribohydrolase